MPRPYKGTGQRVRPDRQKEAEPIQAIAAIKRALLINRLWPASDRAFINNCTF